MLKAIFFDAAGTLFAPRDRIGTTYARIAHEYGVTTSAEEVDASFHRVFRHAPALAFGPGRNAAVLRELERRWWRDLVAESFKRLGTFTDFDTCFEELFARFAEPETWRVDPASLPTLRRSRAQGYDLGMISNFDYRLYGILRGLGLDAEFQTITISSEAGYAKPAPEIFRIALARHGVAPDEALHVGDSEHLDVAGATGAGMAAALIDPSAPVRLAVKGRVARVSTLEALPETAEQIPFP
jgi:putative hydrolase of the HAD superfamily